MFSGSPPDLLISFFIIIIFVLSQPVMMQVLLELICNSAKHSVEVLKPEPVNLI